MGKYNKDDLKAMQSWDLDKKIRTTKTRIIEWYTKWNGKCYVSISGKDSTALAYMCAEVCEMLGYKLTLWYSDTGLEFPEVRKHVREYATWLKDRFNCEVELVWDYPKDRKGNRITFKDVIEKYGYPLISKEVAQKIEEARRNPLGVCAQRFKPDGEYATKYNGRFSMYKWTWLKDMTDIPISHKCCNVMKKRPAHQFEKSSGLKPIVGTTADESVLRKTQWYKSGCNAFDVKRPISKPISFWLDSDVWQFISINNIPYPTVYGEIVYSESKKCFKCTGEPRTGCMYCAYGVHLEKSPNKFQRLKKSHPKVWKYCMKPTSQHGLGMKEILERIGIPVE